MESNTYIEVFRSKLWAIILGAILTGLGCYYVAATYTQWPLYEAKATLLIEEGSASASARNTETLKIYQHTISKIAIRAPLTERVVEEIGLSISAEDLAKLIHVRILDKTWLTEISSRHRDPIIAAAIANAVVESLHQHSEFDVKTKIVSPAKIPQRPLFSSYLFIFTTGILGAIVVYGLLCIAESRNDIVRHERDVQQNLDIPLLGMIDKDQKAGNGSDSMSQQSYQWLFAKVFMSSKSRPSTLLITSPQPSAVQSTFVHTFVNKNLRGESHNQNWLTSTPEQKQEQDEVWQAEEPTLTLNVEQGPVYDLEIDESQLGMPDNYLRTYRHIHIVDAPPVLSNANTMMLAQRFDSVLLVIEAKKTKIRDIKDAIQLLKNSGTPIIGSVLLA